MTLQIQRVLLRVGAGVDLMGSVLRHQLFLVISLETCSLSIPRHYGTVVDEPFTLQVFWVRRTLLEEGQVQRTSRQTLR